MTERRPDDVDTPEASTAVGFDLKEMLVDAAAQDDLLLLDRLDRDAAGQTLIYAVDCNVIDAYLAPSERAGSGDDQALGVGEVFRNATHDQKQAIAYAISRYIFEQLCNSGPLPLLVIPPVDQEVAALQAVADRWLLRTRDDLPSLLERLKAATSESDAALADLASEVNRRFLELTMTSALQQLRRRQRYVFCDEVPSLVDANSASAPLVDVLGPWRTTRELLRFAAAKDRWRSRLLDEGKPVGKPSTARDIDALARLELWNAQLASLEQPHRLVYITSDLAVLNAASRCEIDRTAIPERIRDARPRWTFRDAYVRHPRSFLDREGVMRPDGVDLRDPDQDESISRWLGLMLGEFRSSVEPVGEWKRDRGFVLNQEVEAAIDQAIANSPDGRVDSSLRERIAAGWGAFVQNAELLATTRPDSWRFTEADDPSVAKGWEALSHATTHRANQIQSLFSDAWNNCVGVATEVRVIVGIVNQRPRPHRHPPRLLLDPTLAGEFLELAEQRLVERGTALLSIEEFEQHRAKLDHLSDRGYNYFLVVSYILAQGEHWLSAAFLASHAVTIASDHLAQTGGVVCADGPNGREACYFLAFIRRHLAKSRSDLGGVVELLDRATSVFASEQAASPQVDGVTERFACERLALRHAEILYDWHSKGGAAFCIDTHSLDALSLEFAELDAQVSKWLAEHQSSDRLTMLRQDVLRRARLNSLALALVFGSENERVNANGRLALKLLDATLDEQEIRARRHSDFAGVLLRVGRCLYAYGDQDQRARKRTALAELDAVIGTIDAAPVGPASPYLPYERFRYKFLRTHVERVRT